MSEITFLFYQMHNAFEDLVIRMACDIYKIYYLLKNFVSSEIYFKYRVFSIDIWRLRPNKRPFEGLFNKSKGGLAPSPQRESNETASSLFATYMALVHTSPARKSAHCAH